MLAEGRLPTLAALRERGRSYELDPGSTPLFPSAAYPTLYSGLEIAEHGIYSSFPWFPAEQRVRFMRALSLPRTAWERLPAGRRALVIDPYDNWPPSSGEGLFVSGWQYRNRVAALERWSVPSDAHRKLSRRFGAPALLEDAYGAQPKSRLLAARRHLIDAPARVSALVKDQLASERFDLVWATFSAGHFAGHFLWDTSQIVHGDTVAPAEQAELARTVEDVYEAVDAAVGEILEALDEDADVIVLSPIGMGPFTSRSDMLPELLEAVLGGAAQGSPAGSSMFRLRASVPSSLRAAVARALPAAAVHELAARLYFQGVDWSRTRAIAVPGEHNGYVRLNVRGREREGIVAPEEREELLDELVEASATTTAGPRSHPWSDRASGTARGRPFSRTSSSAGRTDRAPTSARFAPPASARCLGAGRLVFPGTTARTRGRSSCRAPRSSGRSTVSRASSTSPQRSASSWAATRRASAESRYSKAPDSGRRREPRQAARRADRRVTAPAIEAATSSGRTSATAVR